MNEKSPNRSVTRHRLRNDQIRRHLRLGFPKSLQNRCPESVVLARPVEAPPGFQYVMVLERRFIDDTIHYKGGLCLKWPLNEVTLAIRA